MKLLLILLFFATQPLHYHQLQWSDFKGTPPAGSTADAVTCTNISIGMDTAYALFFPDRSWTKTDDPRLLRHEQVHFAITEYFARGICTLRRSGYHKIDWCIEQWRAYERRYDIETNHGTDTTAQAKWEEWAEHNSISLEGGKK